MTLIGYARVSTADQSLEGQLDALKEAGVKSRDIFKEKKSGKNVKDRPALKECLEALETGDTLIVAKLDRLGRSLINLVDIVNELGERGINFQALDKAGMNTATKDGRLMFNLFASLAEYERDLIRERTGVGLKAARERGRIGGRPRVQVDNPKVAKAKDLADKKNSVEDIAAVLGVSRATVYRYLSM